MILSWKATDDICLQTYSHKPTHTYKHICNSPMTRESFRVLNVIKYQRDACTSIGNGKNVQNSPFSFARIFIFNGPEATGRTDEIK